MTSIITKEQIKYKNIFTVISVVMLFLAIPSLFPDGYYQFLRWVVMATAIFILYLSYKLGKKAWLWLMVAITILFNPILPIYLDKETWVVIDFIVAILFLIAIFKIKGNQIES